MQIRWKFPFTIYPNANSMEISFRFHHCFGKFKRSLQNFEQDTIVEPVYYVQNLLRYDGNSDSIVGWPNVGPTSVLLSRRWANVNPTYIAVCKTTFHRIWILMESIR